MADQVKVPRSISKEQFLDQIRAGTHDAMRELMSTGTTNPSADFFAAIQAGVEAAIKAVAREREATTGIRHEAEPGDPVAKGEPKP